jgi:hypothetical protein
MDNLRLLCEHILCTIMSKNTQITLPCPKSVESNEFELGALLGRVVNPSAKLLHKILLKSFKLEVFTRGQS